MTEANMEATTTAMLGGYRLCVTRPQGVCGRLDNVEVTRLSDGKSVKWVQGARPWDPEALVQIADRAFKFGVLFTRPTIATDVVVRRTPAKPSEEERF